jgi:hypothetical protein
MAVAKGIIGFTRWTDSVGYSGGSWDDEYPASNLTLLPLSRVARTTGRGLADTKVVGTFARGRPVRLFGIVRHNLTLDAEYRLRLYEDIERTVQIFDSTWREVWPRVYTDEQLEWEDDQWWSGRYSNDEIAGYNWTAPIWLEDLYFPASFLLEFNDQANPAGYIEIGLLEIAQGWQLGVNYAVGANVGLKHRTLESEALGGVKYFERRDAPRRFDGLINYLPHDEAMTKAFEHQRQLGIDLPFLWFPTPDNPLHWVRNSFLARNVEPKLITLAHQKRDLVPVAFEEVL